MGKNTALHVGCDYKRQLNLARDLKSLGIELDKVSSVPAAKKRMEKHTYDLFLIQLETVDKQIFEFYSFIRSKNSGAIIIVFITKPQSKIEEQLFNYGVDDVVICDSICTSTLASRIKRRFYNGKLSWTQTNKVILKGGTLVNFARREVRLNGFTVTLSSSADRLLRYFLDNPDRVISKDEMWESDLWEKSVCRAGKEENGKAFDMAIGRLRRSIEIDPKNPQIIKTVHGKGWMLARDAVL